MNDGVGAVAKLDLAAESDFRIGGLLVRPSSCRVIDAHGETRTEPRIMEVLLVLWRAHGATVTRDQLIDACWGGRAISDDAITRAIGKVRQLANGGDSQPHFILETLPKVGYRLITPEASPAPPFAIEGVIPEPSPPITAPRVPALGIRNKWLLPLAAAATLTVVLSIAGLRWQQTQPHSNHANAEAIRLTNAARTLIHERNRVSMAEAQHLLREAVAADPNYAPAWARLGHATYFAWWYAEQKEPGIKLQLKAEAIGYINRALAIAPNLAEAQAVMSMVQSDTNDGYPWAVRAVRLDPGSAEAWMWLGDVRREQGNLRGALAAFEKARTLDPAWYYTARPYIELVFRLRGPEEAYRELDRVAVTTNDQNWALQERADLEFGEGRLADAAALAAAALRARPQNPYWARSSLVNIAALLGNKNLQDRILSEDSLQRSNFNALHKPGWAYERAQNSPETWWDATLIGAQAAQLVTEGRSAVLVNLYDRRFKSAEDFISKCPQFCNAISAAPALIIALRRAGRTIDAERVLASAKTVVEKFKRAGDRSFITQISDARLAALSGNAKDATRILRDAVRGGWKGQDTGAPDPDVDPAFDIVRDDPDFQSAIKLLRAAQAAEAERLAHIDFSGI